MLHLVLIWTTAIQLADVTWKETANQSEQKSERYSRDVEEHGLIQDLLSIPLPEVRAMSFDLDTAAAFGLNMLDVRPSRADNLATNVEATNWLESNNDALFGPFTLIGTVSFRMITLGQRNFPALARGGVGAFTDPSVLVSFILLLWWLAAAETAFIDEVWQLLRLQLIDLLNGFVESLLGSACDVEIERRILRTIRTDRGSSHWKRQTAGVAMLLSG